MRRGFDYVPPTYDPLLRLDCRAATLPRAPLHDKAFNDHELLPDPNDPGGVHVEEAGRLHALHPAMQWRKLHERPFSELQGSRDHSENVYDSTLENYCPRAWSAVVAQEPLLPVRGHGPYK